MGQRALDFTSDGGPRRVIAPVVELGAYEALWLKDKSSFAKLAKLFAANPDKLPSELVDPAEALECGALVVQALKDTGVQSFGVRVHRAGEYPGKLRDADHPVELLYYQGWWNLVETRGVAVVGTRKPSAEGRRRARKLARLLSEDGFTVVSGLAAGIDTEAHRGAIEAGGLTYAVIGTPLGVAYPPENMGLQQELSTQSLVISQVPVLRYHRQTWSGNRFWFPERNVTMSALTEATIIVEAGPTSGTLIQARAALRQGRKLFILDSCFQRSDIDWPEKFRAKGAIRVRDFDDLREALRDAPRPPDED